MRPHIYRQCGSWCVRYWGAVDDRVAMAIQFALKLQGIA